MNEKYLWKLEETEIENIKAFVKNILTANRCYVLLNKLDQGKLKELEEKSIIECYLYYCKLFDLLLNYGSRFKFDDWIMVFAAMYRVSEMLKLPDPEILYYDQIENMTKQLKIIFEEISQEENIQVSLPEYEFTVLHSIKGSLRSGKGFASRAASKTQR